jgi:hypothetical protein
MSFQTVKKMYITPHLISYLPQSSACFILKGFFLHTSFTASKFKLLPYNPHIPNIVKEDGGGRGKRTTQNNLPK